MHESQKRRKERIPRVTVNQERMSIDLFAEPLSAKLPGFMCREMPVWKYPRNVYTELIDKIEVKYEKPVKHEIGKYRDEVRYHMKYSTPRFKGRQNSRDEIGFDSRL